MESGSRVRVEEIHLPLGRYIYTTREVWKHRVKGVEYTGIEMDEERRK